MSDILPPVLAVAAALAFLAWITFGTSTPLRRRRRK